MTRRWSDRSGNVAANGEISLRPLLKENLSINEEQAKEYRKTVWNQYAKAPEELEEHRMDIDQASGRHYGMFSGITLATQWDCSAMRTPDIRREPASGSTISRLPSSRHFAWTPAVEPVSELAVGSPSPLPWRRCRRRNSMAGIWFFGSRYYRLERRTARSRKKMLSEPQAHSDDGRPGRQGNRNLRRRQS